MPTTADRKLKVFLCHTKEGKPIVRDLYRKLIAEGWLDEKMNFLPIQEWNIEIRKAVAQKGL